MIYIIECIYDGKIIKNLYYFHIAIVQIFFLNYRLFRDFNPIVSESYSRNIPTHYK